MKKYYKIGEIAKLYSLGTDSLRYYEEIGILNPRRDTNGYRMYSVKDIRTLNVLKELRGIGFTISDIKKHLENYDVSKTLNLFNEEIKLINNKIDELINLKQTLLERHDELEKHYTIQANLEKINLIQLNGRKVLQLNEDTSIEDDVDFLIKKLQSKNESRLHIIGSGYIGATAPLKAIENGQYGHYNSVFYLLSDTSNEYDYILPSGTYMSSTVAGPYENCKARLELMIKKAKKMGHTIIGDPIEIYIIDNHETMNSEEYLTELQILLD